jgi:sialate O-acetylesterase
MKPLALILIGLFSTVTLVPAVFAQDAADAETTESVTISIPDAGTSMLVVKGTTAQVIKTEGDKAAVTLMLPDGYSVQAQIPTKYLKMLPRKDAPLASSVVLRQIPVGSTPVKLPAIFGDHMVLQRGIPFPIWGWAGPNDPITVSIGSLTASTRADDDGKWMMRLRGLPDSATATELDVAGPSNRIAIHDVLIGDVWLCAGQSHMSTPLSQTSTAKSETPLANHPEIRLFVAKFHSSPTALTDCEGSWVVCSPDTVQTFSAVGYFFGKEIAETQKVPLGLIGAYGSEFQEQAWVSLEGLQADDDLEGDYIRPYLKDSLDLTSLQQPHDRWLAAGGAAYLDTMAQWNSEVAQLQQNGQPATLPPSLPAGLPQEPTAPAAPGLPSMLSNSMIAPLIPFALKGVIWYAGETDRPQSDIYSTLLPSLIADWRQRWGEGDFPFLYVQHPAHALSRHRRTQVQDAQLKALKAVSNTGMAITTDLTDGFGVNPSSEGDAGSGSGTNTHTSDQGDVGHRLALVARHLAYGENVGFSGPLFESFKIDGNKIHIRFTNVGKGLKVGTLPASSSTANSDSATQIKGFGLAGVGHELIDATATIESSDSIVVSCDQVPIPYNVAYVGAGNPDFNLFNSDNLPAAAFRTDGPVVPPSDSLLVAQRDDSYTIGTIKYFSNPRSVPNLDFPVYHAATKPDEKNIPQETRVFTPYLEVEVAAKEPALSRSLVARAYFYDQDKKLIASMQRPAKKEAKQTASWGPIVVPPDMPQSIYFEVPDQVQQQSDWAAVVVFGDANGVAAQIYPSQAELKDYDYPGKMPAKIPANAVVESEPVLSPIITHVEKTDNPNQPQITMFMRLPLGITHAAEAKGVLCMSLVAKNVDNVQFQLQGVRNADDVGQVLQFADDHKLIVLCWGSHQLWNPRKNWDEQTPEEARDADLAFDQIAKAWEKGVQYFVQNESIPANNYLLWGESGSAQYACRLALRKPDYFLAVHVHIPSSFDKPTPQANRILWCLTTGELEAGHERSLKFYSQCEALGYPMVYKAVAGLGHAWSPISAELGLRFFEYALSVSNQRLAYDSNPLNQRISTGDEAVQPWLGSFQKPSFLGDIVNQEIFPSDQTNMVPSGFRTPLPTKEIADAWNK